MARKGISAIRMAVNDINEERIIPGLNMSVVIRDSQDPSLYTPTGGPAAISGAVKLIRTKVPLSEYRALTLTFGVVSSV